MGFMSRRVLPVCGSLCVCCPALRSRSRQPVKRYKKLIADAFQEEVPNDRKISKLCDYASRNPLRIPKIAASLEQKGYKELRNEHFGTVKIVMVTYIKLFSACQCQMPLFAGSAINMIRTLLEQTRHDDMRIIGCDALFEFASNQVDATYIHHLDALLPSVCCLARETGEEQRQMQLRSAGLGALSALITFMGEHSYMPSEYNDVVSAIMENYELSFTNEENDARTAENKSWVNEVVKGEGRAFPKYSSQKEGIYSGKLGIPSVCASMCIEKIAQFAKEVTTTRRFLEPIFCYFDFGKHWSPERGLAVSVLHQFLNSVEKLGDDCFLLTVLVRHLDHKNVIQQPQLKSNIMKIIASLAQRSKPQATVVEISILNDILRHLRNSFQVSEATSDHDGLRYNKELQLSVQKCLQEFTRRVGNPTPIFEMMALNLEKLSAVAVISRSTISSILVLSHIMVFLPGLMKTQEIFPEALLHQLSLAMMHPDAETRLGAHKIFSTILTLTPNRHNENHIVAVFDTLMQNSKKHLFRNATMHHSVIMLLETLKNDFIVHQQSITSTSSRFMLTETNLKNVVPLHKRESSKIKTQMEVEMMKVDSIRTFDSNELGLNGVQLSSDQATLLLSSLWSEANMDNNLPTNFELMFETFSLVISAAPAKDSGIFVRVIQLTLSLRTTALNATGHLCPSRQRSLFVLSMAMLVYASKMYNIPGIMAQKNSLVNKGLVDPYLKLDEDGLSVATKDLSQYASPGDNASASEFLAAVRMENDISPESLVSLVLSTSRGMEVPHLQEELLQDKEALFGLDIQISKAHSLTGVQIEKNVSFDKVVDPEEDLISDIAGTDLPQVLGTPIHTPSSNVIRVNELLESARQTAGQVASVSVATSPLPYMDVAMRCEAFGTNTRRKMPLWMNLGGNNNDIGGKAAVNPNKNILTLNPLYTVTHEPWQALQLPPVSHYDNFLRAAGC